MPYITSTAKTDLASWKRPESAGEMNYLFTKIAGQYLMDHGLNYQNINDIIGALEGCKLELYRRVAAEYEEKKIQENGDAYPPGLWNKM